MDMSCFEFESAIEHAVESRTLLDDRAVAHAKSCDACQSVLLRNQHLDVIVNTWQLFQPPANLVDLVLDDLATPIWMDAAQLSADLTESDLWESAEFQIRPAPVVSPVSLKPAHAVNPVYKERSAKSGILAVSALAACLMMFGMVLMNSKKSLEVGEDAFAKAAARRWARSNRSDVQYDVSTTLAEVFSGIQSEYREMASETQTAAREIANSISYPAAPPVITEPENIELLPDAEDVGRILKPIGSRVATALDFLWQAVPSEASAG